MKKRIVILGAGESGTGAAALARKKGFDVFVSDSSPIKDKYRKVLLNNEIDFEEGKHTAGLILSAGEVVKSPGIPEDVPIVKQLTAGGIPVISEIEFAARYTGAYKICITGSNGKTTTSCLTAHLLRKAGLDTGLSGNVGSGFAASVADREFDYQVIELSSFQLDGMYEFRADIAILLNITPDHLDRYGHSFSSYAGSKFRIIRNQTEQDHFIYNADDDTIMRFLESAEPKAKCYPFSLRKDPGLAAWIDRKEMIINVKSKIFKMTLENLALQGKHNIYNSMAATIASRILDIRKKLIKESLADFQNIEHRLEYVARIHGVEFINDSKATNVNSTWYALESMDKPVIWIAGGIDKGNDYDMLKELAKSKVKALICLGKDNSRLMEAFQGVVETIVETASMEEAVKIGLYLGKQDQVVLLSPACASFDLFDDFEDRGNQFKDAVKSL